MPSIRNWACRVIHCGKSFPVYVNTAERCSPSFDEPGNSFPYPRSPSPSGRRICDGRDRGLMSRYNVTSTCNTVPALISGHSWLVTILSTCKREPAALAFNRESYGHGDPRTSVTCVRISRAYPSRQAQFVPCLGCCRRCSRMSATIARRLRSFVDVVPVDFSGV